MPDDFYRDLIKNGSKCITCENKENSGRLARQQSETLQAATRYGQLWTGVELEQVARTDITIQELALRLGRSRCAVATQRHRIRTDPRKIAAAGVRL